MIENLQQWEQASSTHFETYQEAADYKATLEGRVKIRRRRSGFDVLVLTYKAVKKEKPEE